jgi:transposase
MKKQRKHESPEKKVSILRRHKEPISRLCDEMGLQPTVFYRWHKEFFENGTAAFEQKARPNHSADQERIAYLEKKIQTKDEVLAELMAEQRRTSEAFRDRSEAALRIILQGGEYEQGAAIRGAQIRMTAGDTGMVYNSVCNADGIERMARGCV